MSMNHPMDSGTSGRTLDRGDFLKLLGAAGIGAAAGANVLPGMADGAVKTKLDPTDFTFVRKEQYRPFDLLAENFVQLEDGFGTDTTGDYTVLTPGPERKAGAVESGDGELRVSGEQHFTVLQSDTGQEAPYAAVIVDVKSLVGPGNGPEDSIFAGLYKDADNYVHAFYNNRQKIAGFDVVVNGQVFGLGTTRADLIPPFRFAFVANENEVTALVSDSTNDYGFRPLIKRNARRPNNPTGLDLRDTTVLAQYKNGFGARANEGGTIVLDSVQAGYFGEAGVRDPHVIQYADGTPYIKDNKLYFTLTNAGLGFFEKAHWGVWTMDLSDYTKIEQAGNLFFRRADGKVLGHHAGQLVLDESLGRWIVMVSTWGDFGENGVDIQYVETPAAMDLLNGVHVLGGLRPHPVNALTPASPGHWDPGLTLIDGRWYVAFVDTPVVFSDFQPALARSAPGADHTALTLVGRDESKRATEGPILQKLGGQWRLLASCGDDEPAELRGKYPMYDLNMTFDGYLDAPHPTNIPHPQIVPLPFMDKRQKKTKYIMITFNGTQYFEPVLGYGTHGDFFVFEAIQTVRGFEFEPR